MSEVEKVCIVAHTPYTELWFGIPASIQWYDNDWKLPIEYGRRR